MNPIIAFSTHACVHCAALICMPEKMGVDYRNVDLLTNSEGREYVMALGYLQAPVVYAGPNAHLCGFRPDRLAALADTGAA